MRIVVALGGNALQRRGEPMTVDGQRSNVAVACKSLAPVAEEHELVVSHGNGPQVGLLALQAAAYDEASAYPFDILGAQTEGMIGYLIEQELGNLLPAEKPLATILTMTQVDAEDPAFANPTKFVGPVYDEPTAHRLANERGWRVAPDGPYWRRVVPSPMPQRIVETRVVRLLLTSGAVVVCAGGGGVPVIRNESGQLQGVEAVVDKDLATAVLAESLEADALLLLTDVPAVLRGYGTPQAEPISRATPAALRQERFPADSMGPKVDAVCRFVEVTGDLAAIGALADATLILAGKAGTVVTPGGDYGGSHDLKPPR